MKKERILEQEEFEKNYITEALADIRASLVADSDAIEPYGKAYEAMLRLKERFGCSAVSLIFTWLRGANRKIGPAPDIKKRYGREVFSFLQKQPIPIPSKGLDEYQQLWHLYMHPELSEAVNRDGTFHLEEVSLLVTREHMDGVFRTFPKEGPWQLYESYLEALKAKEDLLYKVIEEAKEKLREVNEAIGNEEGRRQDKIGTALKKVREEKPDER